MAKKRHSTDYPQFSFRVSDPNKRVHMIMRAISPILSYFLMVGCVSLPHQARHPSSEPRISFDAHLHVEFSNPSYPHEPALQIFLKDGAEKALLLSQGYLYDPRYPDWGGTAERDEANRLTALLVAKHRDHFRGLCGVGYMWGDAELSLASCLKMPGMIGAKLRFQRGDQLTDGSISRNLTKILKGNEPSLRVVLIHMPNEAYHAQPPSKEQELQRDIASLGFLLDIVDQYPKIQFILAHSLYDYRLLDEVIKRYPNGAPSNLWMDTAAALSNRSNTDDSAHIAAGNRRKVEAWRKLGLSKILYGSDSSLGGKIRSLNPSRFGQKISYKEFLEEMTTSLTSSPDLTTEEVNSILTTNGQAFTRLVF